MRLNPWLRPWCQESPRIRSRYARGLRLCPSRILLRIVPLPRIYPDRAQTVLFGFDRFKLRDAATCDGDNVIDVEATVVSDLLRDEHYPELPTIAREVRRFCRFELRIKRVPVDDVPAGAPQEIGDRAIWLTGRLADGTPFELETVEDDNTKLEAVDGFFALPEKESRLFLAFLWDGWFENLSFDAFTADEDGVLRVDKGDDEEWVKKFRGNVKHSARLFRDLDDDGVLDDAEMEDSLAVGSSR